MGAQVTPPPEPDDFLSRWSARKRAEAASPEPPAAEPASEPQAPQEPPEADPDLLARLPRIEDIGPGTDIRAFLQAGVPRALKNAALRRAWAANPLIANYEDPARDYFWDYNAPGGMLGNSGTISAEDVARMADRIAGGALEAPLAPEADDPAAEPADVLSQPVPPRPEAPPPVVAQAEPQEPATPAPVARRHGGAMPG